MARSEAQYTVKQYTETEFEKVKTGEHHVMDEYRTDWTRLG